MESLGLSSKVCSSGTGIFRIRAVSDQQAGINLAPTSFDLERSANK
jgi:hypothetical protein